MPLQKNPGCVTLQKSPGVYPFMHNPEWTVESIGGLLVAMELGQYADVFIQKSIDGSKVELLDEMWDELGVELKAHRLKIRRRLRSAVLSENR